MSAAGWIGVSLLDPMWAASIPGGATVHRLNGEAGHWLLARSSPLPDCPPGGGGAEKARGSVEGIYRWTDERGLTHFVDEAERVPEKHRSGAKVRSLPLLTVYHGEYSKLRRSAAGVTPAEPRSRPAVAGARAIVYSAEWCGACQKTKAWLAEQGVAVEERDIDKDPRALAELVSIAGRDPAIPVTVIAGKAVGGFDPAGLRSAIAAARR